MTIDVEHLLILVDLQAAHGDQKRRTGVHAVEERLSEQAQALLALAEVLIHAGGAQLVVTLNGFFGRLDIDTLHLGQKLVDGGSREDGALLDELLNLLGVMQGRAEVLADHHAHGRAVRLPLAVPEHPLHMAGLGVVGAAHKGVGHLLVAEACRSARPNRSSAATADASEEWRACAPSPRHPHRSTSGSRALFAQETAEMGGIPFAMNGTDAEHDSDTSADHIAQAATSYNLSPRETEVVELLLHSRSIPYICDELFIAKSTAQTHARHIYAKMDITGGRQELIDRIESADEPKLR